MKVSNNSNIITYVFLTTIIIILTTGLLSQYKSAKHIINTIDSLDEPEREGGYFVNINGDLFRLSALDHPTISDKNVIGWAKTAVLSTLIFDHKNYREHLLMARNRYNNRGWESFTIWLRDNYIIEKITGNSLSIYSTLKDTPKITLEGIKQGGSRYMYTLEAPIEMNYLSGEKIVKVENIILELTIARTSLASDIFGLKIINWGIKDPI